MASFAFAMLVVIALSGVILAVGVQAADPGDGSPGGNAPPAAAAAPAPPAAGGSAPDTATRSTLALQGEWLVLKVESAWLGGADAEAREHNDRRITAILRELNARE
jgi:hypothetical protein